MVEEEKEEVVISKLIIYSPPYKELQGFQLCVISTNSETVMEKDLDLQMVSRERGNFLFLGSTIT